MFDGEAGIGRRFRLVLMVYVVLMTLEVIILESVFDAANTVGVVGISGWIPGGLVYFFGDRASEDLAARVEHLKMSIWGVVWGTGFAVLWVLDTQPFDDGEHAFNLLTCVGVGVVLFYAFMATVGVKRLLS